MIAEDTAATWERMMIDTLDDYDQASPSLRAEWERKQLPGPYQYEIKH
jgi:hypothetical protein